MIFTVERKELKDIRPARKNFRHFRKEGFILGVSEP
jgi:hypothetical protein